jgi:cation:H+ antiporter
MDLVFFLAALFGILAAAELFTNAVEDLGDKLGLSHGVVGSILAAVGTALPETLVPIVALLAGSAEVRNEIANGAILGAPFMLATLGFTIIGVAALLKRDGEISTNHFLIKRDLTFFLIMFTPPFILAFVPDRHTVKVAVGILLLLGYAYYIYHVIKEGGEEVEADKGLYMNTYLKLPDRLAVSVLQLILSLIILLIAVEVFVHAVAHLSKLVGISPLVFSLLVAPIATELPEKFNSFFWSLRGQYELAFGNITGAMVFQSAIPVSLGLIFTDWRVGVAGELSAFIAILGGLLVLLQILLFKKIKAVALLLNGALYLLYVALVLTILR